MRTFIHLTLILLLFLSVIPREALAIPAKNLGDAAEFTRVGDTFNITTTTGALVRIEIRQKDLFRIWAGPIGKLTDEGSRGATIVLDQPPATVNANLQETEELRIISTPEFSLRIYPTPLRFSLYRADDTTLLWRELKPLNLDSNCSCQTLSSHSDEHFYGGGQQNGSFEFKGRLLEISYSGGWEEGDRPSPAPFYMSSAGYGVLRNTWSNGRYDFRSDEYLTSTHEENRFDAFYFVGSSIHRLLDLYTQLTGRAGLLPRWAFEYGDADCYNDHDNSDKPGTVPPGWSDGPTGTTPDVVATVAEKYREHDMPGGWILPNDGYGCGYTDLPTVVRKLRALGFHTGLWTENGINKIAWEVGQAGTRVQKLDVAWTGEGYQFCIDANRDAAQGILNNSDSRPFLWTVMGWAGIQRYAVTWTGDQSGSWDYIRWHVPTLIGSGLSGMVYSTGDVDGIYGGTPETFTRDLQWKCFTPVLMGMSGWSKVERKHPWWFDEPYRSINRHYLKLKMQLMPYMYTLAREAERTGAPIVRGLMWDHPDDPRGLSEEIKNQFFLGRDLLIAPVFRGQAESGGWRDSVYLPKGTWIDYWDGTVTRTESEGLFIDYPVTLDKLPVFVRAGAILPMYPVALYDGQVPKDVLTLDVYPFGESEYTLYEDDGHTRANANGAFTTQLFRVFSPDGKDDQLRIAIEPAQGQFDGMYEHRVYSLQVHSHRKPDAVSLDGIPVIRITDSAEFARARSGWYYLSDDRRGVIHIKTDAVSTRAPHLIDLDLDCNAIWDDGGEYPAKPIGDSSVSSGNLMVISRPTEEPGFPLENAFDHDPATWFRTIRNQSVKTGPHEFVLSLGARRVIDGFRIAPRNDKWWKYGQVRRCEVYLSDANGEWGEPVWRDTIALSETSQTVHFAPSAGWLVKFRFLSTHDMEKDPMVLAVDRGLPEEGYNALQPMAVNPVTISELQILEHRPPAVSRQQVFLSDADWSEAHCASGTVARHPSTEEGPGIQMNGLTFTRRLTVRGNSRIDYHLIGNWQSFRVEAGLDDGSLSGSEVHFQVLGNDRLLYDSGRVRMSDIAKPELDIRGISKLSLVTVDCDPLTIAHWANPRIEGLIGDTVGR